MYFTDAPMNVRAVHPRLLTQQQRRHTADATHIHLYPTADQEPAAENGNEGAEVLSRLEAIERAPHPTSNCTKGEYVPVLLSVASYMLNGSRANSPNSMQGYWCCRKCWCRSRTRRLAVRTVPWHCRTRYVQL
jgi:hypothetical protein